MRVAIFFDGKNFHSGLRSVAGTVRLDFPKLAGWLLERAGGDALWGAHYYTGIERGEAAASEGQRGLTSFLNALEMQPGYFVHRFPRKAQRRTCPHCGEVIAFTQEKEVDTTMVADILRLAAVDGFDILVLVSGDADLAPAVENVRALGKKVYVATWGRESLAARIRQAAFDHIDLRAGFGDFRYMAPVHPAAEAAVAVVVAPTHEDTEKSTEAMSFVGVSARPDAEDADSVAEAAFLLELGRAEAKFSAGYVGVSFFLSRWRSEVLDPLFQARQRLLDRLVEKRRVEIYDAPDGSKAMRRLSGD